MLEVKFKLTESEYFDYSYFTAWSSPGKRRYRTRYYLQVTGLYLAVAGLYLFSTGSLNSVLGTIVFFLIGLIYFFSIPLLVKRSIRSRVRTTLSAEENRHVLEESVVTLTSTGVMDADTATQNWYNWDDILLRADTRQCIFLYTNAYHAIVIPKRALSAKDREALESILSKHLLLSAQL